MSESVHVWRIAWNHSHYRPPPDGFPAELARQCVKMPAGAGGRIPKEIESLWYAHKPPHGYGIWFSSLHSAEKRALTQAGRAKIRRNNMRRRIQQKAPLFAKELEQRELEAQPEYFGGMRPQEQEQAIREDAERRLEDWKAASKGIGLVILFKWWEENNAAAT